MKDPLMALQLRPAPVDLLAEIAVEPEPQMSLLMTAHFIWALERLVTGRTVHRGNLQMLDPDMVADLPRGPPLIVTLRALHRLQLVCVSKVRVSAARR